LNYNYNNASTIHLKVDASNVKTEADVVSESLMGLQTTAEQLSAVLASVFAPISEGIGNIQTGIENMVEALTLLPEKVGEVTAQLTPPAEEGGMFDGLLYGVNGVAGLSEVIRGCAC